MIACLTALASFEDNIYVTVGSTARQFPPCIFGRTVLAILFSFLVNKSVADTRFLRLLLLGNFKFQ